MEAASYSWLGGCSALLSHKNSAKDIKGKRQYVRLDVAPMWAAGVRNQTLVFQLLASYDENFFGGNLRKAIRAKNWEVRVRMEDLGFQDPDDPFRADRIYQYGPGSFEVVLDVGYPKAVFEGARNSVIVAGVRCHSELECLMVEMEHQIVHLLLALACDVDETTGQYPLHRLGTGRLVLDDMKHAKRYQTVAKNIFGLKIPKAVLERGVHGKHVYDNPNVAKTLGSFFDMNPSYRGRSEAILPIYGDTFNSPNDIQKKLLHELMQSGDADVSFYDPRFQRWRNTGYLQKLGDFTAEVLDTNQATADALTLPIAMVASKSSGISRQLPRGFYGDLGKHMPAMAAKRELVLVLPSPPEPMDDEQSRYIMANPYANTPKVGRLVAVEHGPDDLVFAKVHVFGPMDEKPGTSQKRMVVVPEDRVLPAWYITGSQF